MYENIQKLDSSYNAHRAETLKGRLAEAARDEGLRRELRRLNIESPDLSFFEVRDRALQWLGSSQPKRREAKANEVKAEKDGLQELIRHNLRSCRNNRSRLLSLQIPSEWPSSRGPRRCWICNSTGHLKGECPKRTTSEKPGGKLPGSGSTPLNQDSLLQGATQQASRQ